MRPRPFLCLLAALGLPPLASAQGPVPVHRETRHHLVLDSTRFRILDVQIPARDTTGYHIHDTAILYVSLATSPTAAQLLGGGWPSTPATPPLAAVGDVRIDSTYVDNPVTHRVTNAGTGPFRLLAITSSGPSRESTTDGPGMLPGVVELRSTWFQQSRVQLPARSRTGWLVSASPVLVVQPLASGLQVEFEAAARRTLDGPGSWALVPALVRYRITNDGGASATALAIQIR